MDMVHRPDRLFAVVLAICLQACSVAAFSSIAPKGRVSLVATHRADPHMRASGVFRASRPATAPQHAHVPPPRISDKLSALAAADGLLLVDFDNVRGKTDFALSHSQLLVRLARWAAACGVHGRTAFVVDHGAVAESHYVPSLGAAVTFAGSAQTADDAITADVGAADRVMLVTADRELIARSRAAATRNGGSLTIVAPTTVLAAMVGNATADDAGTTRSSATAVSATVAAAAVAATVNESGAFPHTACPEWLEESDLALFEAEMRASSNLLRAQRLTRLRRGAASKQRGLLRAIPSLTADVAHARHALACAKLPSIETVVHATSATHARTSAEIAQTASSIAEEESRVSSEKRSDELLRCLVARQRKRAADTRKRQIRVGGAPEHTYDRVCAAEVLRRKLSRLSVMRCARADRSGSDDDGLGEAVAPRALRYTLARHARGAEAAGSPSLVADFETPVATRVRGRSKRLGEQKGVTLGEERASRVAVSAVGLVGTSHLEDASAARRLDQSVAAAGTVAVTGALAAGALAAGVGAGGGNGSGGREDDKEDKVAAAASGGRRARRRRRGRTGQGDS